MLKLYKCHDFPSLSREWFSEEFVKPLGGNREHAQEPVVLDMLQYPKHLKHAKQQRYL